MTGKSKFERLPAALRAEIEGKLREQHFTLDELMAFVRSREPGADISRAGLHRYLRSFEETAKRLREAQAVAGAVVGKLVEQPQGDLGRLLAQLLQVIAFYQLHALEDQGTEVKPAELVMLARAIKDMEQAGKLSAEREIKIRKELAGKVDNALRQSHGTLEPAMLERVKQIVRGALDA